MVSDGDVVGKRREREECVEGEGRGETGIGEDQIRGKEEGRNGKKTKK